MKAILRAFLGWLDRKFPDKVVVTQAMYEKLERRVNATNYEELRKLHDRQMDELRKLVTAVPKENPLILELKETVAKQQDNINMLNISMGFGPASMLKATQDSGLLQR